MKVQKILMPTVAALMTTVAAAQNVNSNAQTDSVNYAPQIVKTDTSKKERNHIGIGIAYLLGMGILGVAESIYKINEQKEAKILNK